MLSLSAISAEFPPRLQGFKRNMLREYLQYKILEIIFNSRYAGKLSFIGGTALRIIYNNSRFSEDLDFDNFGLTAAEVNNLSAIVKTGLEREGNEVEIRTVFKGAFRCYLKLPRVLFNEGLAGRPEEKILIQLDSSSHNFDYRPERKLLNRFDVLTEIFVTPPDILLSQKINAALSRKRAKGRDFYDILFMWPKTKPNYDYLKLKLKLDIPAKLKRALLTKAKTLDFKQLGRELRPFLFDESAARKLELFGEVVKRL